MAFVFFNEPLRYAILHLQPLALAAVFVAACIGLGVLARGGDFVTSAALGFGIVGAMTFVAALLHILKPATFTVILAVGVVSFAVWCVMEHRLQPVDRLKPVLHFGWIILAVVMAIILPFVVAPDVSTDALEYHLLIPRLMIDQNAIRYQPLLVESNYPSLGEYDFIPLLILSDARTAKCFHFLCAILLLFAIGRLAQSNGVLAAALFFSMPVVAMTSGWAWNDMLFTLFVVLCLVHLREEHFVLAGVLFGFATWTKYTFVLAGIGIAAMLLRERARNWIRFAIPAVAISAIWLTKNFVLTGNPVYPFLNGIFHSPFWTAASDRYFHITLTRFEIPEWHWWTYVAFPFLLTLKPRVIDVQTGVLPLVLLPLLFTKRQQAAALQRYVIGIVVGWLLIRTEARSLLSMFAVLSAIYASEIERLRGWRAVVGLGAAMNVVIMLVTTNVVTDPARYFLGLEARDQYIVRMDPKQGAYRWLDQQPGVGRVMLVSLHDPYYLGKPALFSSCCDTPIVQTVALATLKSEGVTHIAFRPREYERENADGLYSWTKQEKVAFEAFLRDRCRLVARSGDVLLFQLM